MRRVLVRTSAFGFTLLELTCALALVGLAIASGTTLLLRAGRLQAHLEERLLAREVVVAELARARQEGLPAVGTSAWRTRGEASCGLAGACGSVHVSRLEGTDLRRLRVSLEWGAGFHVEAEELL